MLSLNTGRRTNKPFRTQKSLGARRARNISITVVVLLLLSVLAGVIYTWYVGAHTTLEDPKAAKVDERLDPVMKPRKMAPDAVVGASVQMLTSPLEPGANAMINVKTNPDAECTISVIYDKTASTDSGLMPKVADEYGIVSWTWTVDTSAALGTWPVKVTCANKKNSAVVVASLKLEKKPVEATAGN